MEPLSAILPAATFFAVVGLLVAEERGSRRGVAIFKPLASATFIALAIVWGAMDTLYGQLVLAALALSWIGDVLLIPDNSKAFLGGLGSFLLAHVVFAVAFVSLGVSYAWAGASLLLLVPFAAAVGRWLLPHVKSSMKGPVVAYMVAISAMVALATGAYAVGNTMFILTGAVLFFLSDLTVARDRFINKAFINRAYGLPLYYGAQVVLAYSVKSVV